MKKQFSLLLCLFLLITCLQVAASNPAHVTTAASATALQRGDTVTLTVKVENSPSVEALAIKMGAMCDGTRFELVSAKWLIGGGMLSDVDMVRHNAVIMYNKARILDGDVFEITLKVKDAAPFGKVTLTAEAVFGSAAANLPVTYTGCEVEIACPHSWKAADCAYPETCSLCGSTRGTALGHSYAGDTCSRCGLSKEQAAATTTTTVAPTTTTSDFGGMGKPTDTTTVIVGGVTTTTGAAGTTKTVPSVPDESPSATIQTGGTSQTTSTTVAVPSPQEDTTDKRVFVLLCAVVALAIGGCVVGVLIMKKKR